MLVPVPTTAGLTVVGAVRSGGIMHSWWLVMFLISAN